MYATVMIVFMITYNMALCWLAYSRIAKYKKRFKVDFSKKKNRYSKWLYYFILSNLSVFTFAAFAIVYCSIKDQPIPFIITDETVLLFFLLFFVYYLITKPEFLPTRNHAVRKPEQKYAKVNLPVETRKKYSRLIEDSMLEKQAYLDEDLSVSRLSKKLDIPSHHLSMTINTEFNQNFYNYINRHRIEYAENLLKDPEEIEESILMIAYRSGFKSKASFNKAFKSITEMTPSAYRKRHAPEITPG